MCRQWSRMAVWALGLAVLGFPSSARAADCVGVYDEDLTQTNTVDFTTSGSGVDFPTFKSEIPDEFASNAGGVLNCHLFRGSRQYTFGAAGTKLFHLNEALGTTYGLGASGIESTPISDDYAFAGSPPSFHGVAWNV